MATAAVAEQPREQMKPADKYKPVSDLKKQYEDFLSEKDPEIREARQSRHYYHANQWTTAQLEILKNRKQPYVTYNRVARKIDGIAGLLGRMKQDPKAYARTPQHEQGAELATAALRFVFDQAKWEMLQTAVGRKCAIDGLCGVDLSIVDGKNGEKNVHFELVDQDLFFYDPRSFKADFSDCLYLGTAKWVDLEVAKTMFPDKVDELEGLVSARFVSELGPDHEREVKWTNVQDKKVRIADHWYQMRGQWCWTIYCSDVVLKEGKSYLVDENGEGICRYLMFSCNVDHDGDRYSFVRNLKGPQDEINQRRSKALHQSVSRRMIVKRGSVGDVEVARREGQRSDGVIEYDGPDAPQFDDAAKQADMRAQLEFLLEAKNEIENYGPNPALIGQGVENKSGRAIALMQQAGVAELGPFIEAWKDWKLRVYRAAWAAVQKYWTGERWIRVTDDEGLAQFIQINKMTVGPMGMPQMVNPIGQLDVDIILDEGEDVVNMTAEFYETLKQVLPPVAPMLSPPKANALIDALIENSPIPSEAKKRYRDASQNRPDPMQEQAKQIELAGAVAKVQETQSKTRLNDAKVAEAGMPDIQQPQQMEFQLPPQIQMAEALAGVEDKQASAMQKRAQAFKTEQDARMAPIDMAIQANDRAADRMTQQAIAERRQREARPNG